ncbi:MAG: cephalosporin hydroxylase family protein [Acidobacteriia bacterium]|nr:cephalosporin hydroxylase family protein [Terriglobia bacterium]
MKIIIDTAARHLTTVDGGSERTFNLYSKAAFEAISREWVRVGWSLRYYHNFSWFGHTVLQLPEDLIRLQEVVYRVRPDVIIETGVFGGGSLMFHATLCQALGKGRVIGIDQHIDAAQREAISRHLLGSRISLIEGDSVSAEVTACVGQMVRPEESVLVILDSGHTKDHVARELECYSRFVTPGSYIIATDGIMRELADVPGGQPEWTSDNPLAAVNEFAARHPEFRQQQPAWLFHAGELTENVTYWPGAWLERLH